MSPGASHAPTGRRGVLLVLAGTSGAGKGTIGEQLRATHPELRWSVSWTTRPPREGEVEGVDYHFVTRAAFEALRDAGGFLEWFEVYGDLKGTPQAFVDAELAAGHDVMLEVDVQGALAVRAKMPEALLVFVRAPSREEQRRRLLARGSETDESIERRLGQAAAEEELAERDFDAVVVNDTVEQAVREVAAILDLRRRTG
ncbi:MAG TPA: guanylate kinase [Acidimicrobiia bacterium]|nr:guanylate kinase [Acidimicrobiia bacterium]